MDTPTRERPAIDIKGGVRVMRGYEVISEARDKLCFVGAPDGPLVQISGSGDRVLLFPIGMAVDLIAALQAAVRPPVAAPGAHDAELRAMGYLPPGRDS